MAMTGPTHAPAGCGRPRSRRPVPGMPPRQPERRASSWVMAVLAALGVLAVVALGIGLALANRQQQRQDQTPPTVSDAEPDRQDRGRGARRRSPRQDFTTVSVGDPIETDAATARRCRSRTPTAGQSVTQSTSGQLPAVQGPGQGHCARQPGRLDPGGGRRAADPRPDCRTDFKNVRQRQAGEHRDRRGEAPANRSTRGPRSRSRSPTATWSPVPERAWARRRTTRSGACCEQAGFNVEH